MLVQDNVKCSPCLNVLALSLSLHSETVASQFHALAVLLATQRMAIVTVGSFAYSMHRVIMQMNKASVHNSG